jgi:outer membrane protein assembly factor BamB
VDRIYVGELVDHYHAIDLATMAPLWSRPRSPLGHGPLSDGDVLILKDQDVAAVDLMTGAVRWERSASDLGGTDHRGGCIWGETFVAILGAAFTALDLKTGKTIWRWPVFDAVHDWYPYDGRGYVFFYPGIYFVFDLATGRELFRHDLGRYVPEPVRGKKRGLMSFTRGKRLAVRHALSKVRARLQGAIAAGRLTTRRGAAVRVSFTSTGWTERT